MGKELIPIRPDIEAALGQLALCGGKIAPAARRSGVAWQTLKDWREAHSERYLEIATRISGDVESAIVSEARELALSVSETERLALQRTHERLDADTDNMPAATLLRLSTAKGINLTKLLELTGRPTQIVEHRDRSELMRAIKSRATILDAEVIEE